MRDWTGLILVAKVGEERDKSIGLNAREGREEVPLDSNGVERVVRQDPLQEVRAVDLWQSDGPHASQVKSLISLPGSHHNVLREDLQ